MLVHDSPACTPLPATYKKRVGVSETLETTGTQITIIFWSKESRLETGLLGVSNMVKISKEQLATPPKKRDTIVIQSQNYIVETVSLRANNSVFDDFYELEVKSENPNPL